MKSCQLFFSILFLVLFLGCQPEDLCEEIQCGPGNCIEGTCECPCGFSGVNCEIENLCSGVVCCNGICDSQTETCKCDPNYYGESCTILCVNGEFDNGNCNCSAGYEGIACKTESRDNFLGWWSCEQWTWTTEMGDSTIQVPLQGSIKLDCGNGIPELVLFPTDNSNGLMLLNSENKIVGLVTGKTINFELQYFAEYSIYGSASLDADRMISLELYFINLNTSVTEVAKGKFTIYRTLKDCN